MTDTTVITEAQRALTLALSISAPLLGFALVTGLTISILQAATQIHEMTLTFIPKILAMAGALVVFGPWMLHQMVNYTTNLLQSIPSLVR